MQASTALLLLILDLLQKAPVDKLPSLVLKQALSKVLSSVLPILVVSVPLLVKPA